MSDLTIRNHQPLGKRVSRWAHERKLGRNWQFYLMLLLPLAWYFIFCYMPMYGITIGFKKYKAMAGIWNSEWLGLKWFRDYFASPYFTRTLYNTFTLSLLSLLCGFPLPILLALMLNEVSNRFYQKFVQNVTYIPHFLSTVVIVGLLTSFTNRDYGIANKLIEAMGGTADNWMQVRGLFRPLYIGSGVWQNMGWDSIIYIAALAGIDPQLHESAYIDGANRLQCVWHINLPGIMPTIVILLILNSGNILSIGFEKVYLMQNSMNMDVSDVIATYVYRISLLDSNQFELSTAIGLFNSAVNCAVLVIVNQISRSLGETKLW